MKIGSLTRVLVIASAVGVVAAVTISAPARASTPTLNYVAMGDSYSAGSGILPLDPNASLLCARSTLDYPHDIAAQIGASLTDVTCGGATTADFSTSQYPGVAPQLNALSASTNLVTMTIGGNDNNVFIDAVLACGTAGIATLGFGDPCQTLYGSSFDNTIETKTYPAVKAALQEVRAAAPNARIAIIGYPWILPAQSEWSCYPSMPIAMGDYSYVRDIESHLNAAVQEAASQTGVTYVDMSQASAGHDACQSIGTRWVEPALFGTNYVPVHPNALGESMMGAQAIQQLGLG